MLATLRNAWRISDLRRRILFTVAIFLVFRVGTHIPVPGIDVRMIEDLFQKGTLFSLLDMFSGGALKTFSIFALSVYPYITSSIVMQLLTVAIPKLEEMSKEGEEGRRKLNQYTRYGTVLLAFIQGIGMSFGLRHAIISPTFGAVLLIALTLTAGTVLLMWLGEQITDKGIGNGISLIIFAGIVSRVPHGIAVGYTYLAGGTMSILMLLLLLAAGALAVVAVVWITEGERRIPVQYAKRVVGRRMYGGQTTHIPLKVNHAGVIPVIFASSLLAFPLTIATFVRHPVVQKITVVLGEGTPSYLVVYGLLIVVFTYFYTGITFNPVDVANNIKKWGGFIPGLRPGRSTAEFLERILGRITIVGAIFLALIALMPYLIGSLSGIPGLGFGGTGLIIVVGVALETMKQIEAHMLMRHYQGFIK